MALGIGGQLAQQLETLLARLACADTGVRLVDDDKFRAGTNEVVAMSVGLDVIQANHGEGMGVEDRIADRQPTLKAGGAAGGDRHRRDMETLVELAYPLLDEMRRAKYGHALDLAAVEQLTGNQRGLDGLADADIVGDQQAHRIQAQRH